MAPHSASGGRGLGGIHGGVSAGPRGRAGRHRCQQAQQARLCLRRHCRVLRLAGLPLSHRWHTREPPSDPRKISRQAWSPSAGVAAKGISSSHCSTRCSPHEAKNWLIAFRHFARWALERKLMRNDPTLGVHGQEAEVGRIRHVDRGRDRAVRGALADWLETPSGACARAVHGTAARRRRAHRAAAHPRWRADCAPGEDRRDPWRFPSIRPRARSLPPRQSATSRCW